MAITREQLLAALVPVAAVKLVAGVGDLRIRPVTEAQFSSLGDVSSQGKDAFLSKITVLSLVDDGDAPLLTDADIPALQAGAFGPVQAIFSAVADVNNLGRQEKNSEATLVADSSSV